MQVSTFMRLAALSTPKTPGQSNPFSLDGANLDIAQQSNRFRASQGSDDPTRGVGQDQDSQEKLKQLNEMIQRQQQELQKLQQAIATQQQGLVQNIGDPQSMGQIQPLFAAMDQKNRQINDLQNMASQVTTSGQIGGFVGQPLGSGQKISFMA